MTIASLPAIDVDRWRAAIRRGHRWLAARFDQTPPFDAPEADLNWFAKLAWPFAAVGDRARAWRVLNHVETHLVKDGRIEPPAQVAGTNAISYALGWLVCGARAAEMYDSARRMYECLRPYVDHEHGALRSALAEPEADFDVAIQGALLHAAVAMGDLSTAKAAAEFVIRWFTEQPEPERVLYCFYRPVRGYRTAFDPAAPGGLAFVHGARRQPFANLGFALQGLVRVGEATGEHRFIEASAQIARLLLRHNRDDLLGHGQNHKVGHACLLLALHTGDELFRDAALAIASHIARRIRRDGRVHADVGSPDFARQSYFFTIRTGCDSVLWLTHIADAWQTCETEQHP